MSVLELDDDVLVRLLEHVRSHVAVARFHACCRRALALTARREALYLTSHFNAEVGWSHSSRLAMLAPTAWAARYSGLKCLAVDALSLSGAARLLMLLRNGHVWRSWNCASVWSPVDWKKCPMVTNMMTART